MCFKGIKLKWHPKAPACHISVFLTLHPLHLFLLTPSCALSPSSQFNAREGSALPSLPRPGLTHSRSLKTPKYWKTASSEHNQWAPPTPCSVRGGIAGPTTMGSRLCQPSTCKSIRAIHNLCNSVSFAYLPWNNDLGIMIHVPKWAQEGIAWAGNCCGQQRVARLGLLPLNGTQPLQETLDQALSKSQEYFAQKKNVPR